MEQRTSYHDTHNRLVTVFLRKLEYYQGILFLTSNRGIHFDDAILSRIHLIIKYKEMSRELSRGLWSTFLTKARTVQGPAMIEEHDLRRLESFALNGREIKNIAAIAHALAEADASQVSYKHLELAAESKKKFRKSSADRRYIFSSSIPGKLMWIISFLAMVERFGSYCDIFLSTRQSIISVLRHYS
ncbi:hypothetical protein BDW75DRAFT_63288 [Aspergillus navahoensis]